MPSNPKDKGPAPWYDLHYRVPAEVIADAVRRSIYLGRPVDVMRAKLNGKWKYFHAPSIVAPAVKKQHVIRGIAMNVFFTVNAYDAK